KPVPEDVHVALVALPPMVPDSGTGSPAQIVSGVPASTVASGSMVITISSDTATHGPGGSFVGRVSVTVPAALSSSLGVYVALRDVALSNDPVPDEVHVAEEAPPPIVPVSTTELEEHIVWSGPASTVGRGLMVRVITSETAGHGPAGSSVVTVSVTK